MDLTVRPVCARGGGRLRSRPDGVLRHDRPGLRRRRRAPDLRGGPDSGRVRRRVASWGAPWRTFQMTVPAEDAYRRRGSPRSGVLPTHRRRGILTSLMREQLEDVQRPRRAPRRPVGVGVGDLRPVRLRRGRPVGHDDDRRGSTAPSRCRWSPPSASAWWTGTRPFARSRRCTSECCSGRPGQIARNEAWWKYSHDRPRARPRGGERRTSSSSSREPTARGLRVLPHAARLAAHLPAAVLRGGRADGAVTRGPRPSCGATAWTWTWSPRSARSVPAARRAAAPPAGRPAAPARRAVDGLYVRTVDVAAALAAPAVRAPRDAGPGGRATRFCPWNDGRYALDGGPDGAECARTEDEPEVRLDATALGAVYLGGVALPRPRRRAPRGGGRPGALGGPTRCSASSTAVVPASSRRR